MSRPVKRDAARDERVLEALRGGNTREVAAAYAGYGKSTLYRYLKKRPEFCNKVEAAEAEAEARAVAMILEVAAKGTWARFRLVAGAAPAVGFWDGSQRGVYPSPQLPGCASRGSAEAITAAQQHSGTG